MTETGSIMGTAQYLSPEQAQGHAVSAGSDLYSIGVVLYEMLTGRVPFDGESAVTIALKHVSEAPPPPSAINPAVPPELEQVVLWALNKDPADRPADADEFITALEARRAVSRGQRGQRTASMAALARSVAPARYGRRPRRRAPADAAPPPTPSRAATRPYYADGAPRSRRPTSARCGRGVALLVLLLAGGGVAAYLLTRAGQAGCPDRDRPDAATTARAILQNDGFRVQVAQRHQRQARRHGDRPGPAGRRQGEAGLDRHADRLQRARRARRCPSVVGQSHEGRPEGTDARRGFKHDVQHEPRETIAEGQRDRAPTRPPDSRCERVAR